MKTERKNLKLAPYPEYVDSGVPWLGKIPKGWRLKRIKEIARLNIGWTPDTSRSDYFEGENPWATIRDLDEKVIFSNASYISDAAVFDTKIKKVKKGTLLYSFKLSVGKVAFAGRDLYTNEAIAALETEEDVDSGFLYYPLLDYTVNNANENIYGAKLLNQHLINNSVVAVPPKDEQVRIAKFLDSSLEKVDLLVAKKRHFVELLKEERAAVIHRAVTRGLDPKAALVDSGVPWLGKIPKGWRVSTLRRIGMFTKGGLISKKELTDEGVPVLIYGDIYTKYDIKTASFVRKTTPEIAAGSPMIKQSDLLFTGSGETAEDIGKCVTYTGEEAAYAGGDVIMFRQDKEDSLFLSYQQNSGLVKSEKASMAKGQIIVHISASQLKNVHAVLPPLPEQRKIVDYLEDKTANIDALIQKTLHSIDLLTEYRASLITSVVTGKVKLT